MTPVSVDAVGIEPGDYGNDIPAWVDNPAPPLEAFLETADVFLTRINVPSQLNLRDDEKELRLRVFGDGDTIEQEATVTLTATVEGADEEGVEVEIEPESRTKTLVPGGRDTRFDFEAEVECEESGSYEITWTATIEAAENVDPTNDTVEAVTRVQCRGDDGGKKKGKDEDDDDDGDEDDDEEDEDEDDDD
jgi:hypothetical protein